MSSPEFEEVNVGDVVRTKMLGEIKEAVVIQVDPRLCVGHLAIDEAEIKKVTLPFTCDEPVRVIGKLTIDETATSIVRHMRNTSEPDERDVEGWRQVLTIQHGMGPIEHPKLVEIPSPDID